MRDYGDEAYLHARIYAKRSRLLSLKDYVSLSKTHEDALYDGTVRTTDPVSEEDNVFREQIAEIMPLAEASGMYAPLFLAFFRQFEAVNAKLILAKAFGMQPLEQWYDIGDYAVLERGLINRIKMPEDIRSVFRGTYLGNVLEDTSSYEEAEIMVDLCSAKNLYEASAPFPSGAREDFLEIMGRRVAVTTVIMSIRLKKTYHWDDERIRPYIERLHDIFEGNALPHVKVVEEMLSGHLERQRAIGAKEPDIAYMEHYLDQNYFNWISAMFHRDFHSVWCVVAYIWLLYYQIRNLFRIMEGRRFGFPSERILTRIVCNV